MTAAVAWNHTHKHIVPVGTNQSVTLWYQGAADRAMLILGGNVVDQVTLGNQTTGQPELLNFFNGQPIHRGLAEYSACEVKFISQSPTPPVVSVVCMANNLTWADIGNNFYNENVTLTEPGYARQNNIMLYLQTGSGGMCALKYAC
jgi:hypothetical protein